MLNPTYKSRSDDFKRLFKDLPDSERLIVGKWFAILIKIVKISVGFKLRKKSVVQYVICYFSLP